MGGQLRAGGSANRATRVLVMASEPLELAMVPGLGARLHRLRAFGHDLLRTPDDPAEHARDTFFWGAFVMAPWCNRLAARRLQLGASTVDLPANFRDGTAIHGQVYGRPWRVTGEGSFEVEAGGDGWPWPYRVTLAIRLDGATLAIEQAVRNLSDERMPAGIGLHPWFRPAPELALRAERVYTSNTDSAPRPAAVTGAHDLRRLGRMAAELDATWADVASPQVELYWPQFGLSATLAASTSAGEVHITAASPSDVDAIALEPQTHAPQGLRRLVRGEPGALAWLEPRGELRLSTQMTFRQTSGENEK